MHAFGRATFAALAILTSMVAGCAPRPAPVQQQAAAGPALPAFETAAALDAYLAEHRKVARTFRNRWSDVMMAESPAASTEAAAAPPAAVPAPENESVTNTQVAGVDEGGLVKTVGDHLVVLRRGRLFSVSTRDGGLAAIDAVNAYPPGVDASGDWYDEMLVKGDQVIVVGYSYARGGTEINRFRLGADGRFTFIDAHQMKSWDYYSSRNYASRLIGDTLVFYVPLPLGEASAAQDILPAVRRWTGNPSAPFETIATPASVHIPPAYRERLLGRADTLHAVVSCPLTAETLACRSTSVLGASARTFFVSGGSVWLWVSVDDWQADPKEEAPQSMLYRLPLDGGAPSVTGVRGQPTDQFSFHEDAAAGRLHVLVRSQSAGDAMWRPEFAAGSVALLTLPFAALSDGSSEAPPEAYRELPKPERDYSFVNRITGGHVLYGVGQGWGEADTAGSRLTVVPLDGGELHNLALPHGADRIEAMGRDALVVGGGPDGLTFTTIGLASGVTIGPAFTQPGAGQSETRSHGFFYRPDADAPDQGVIALPVTGAGRPGYQQLTEGAAAITFLKRGADGLSAFGELMARGGRQPDDGCVASCTDWYGNARPVFFRNRIFALMGYEIVEGAVSAAGLTDLRRIDITPDRRQAGAAD